MTKKELEAALKAAKRKPEPETEIAYQAKIASLKGDNASLKRKLTSAVKEQGIFQAIAEEMESMVIPLEPVTPYVSPPRKDAIVEHMVMHLSDMHADAIVEPHQVSGLETYNFDVATCRAELYIETILNWKRDLPNHQFPVLHILNYGDQTNGEIHGAKERSTYRNMFRNCFAIGQLQALMIRDLAKHFEQIFVYCVPGNHGRRSQKKDFHGAWDNWDYMVYETAHQHLANQKNVQMVIPNCFSMNVEINGWGFGIEHGDGIKGWNGIPFYGLERKTRRLTALNHSMGRNVDYFVFGHFHQSSSMNDLRGGMLVNGAWCATDPYSFESFAGYREPCQLLHGVHVKKGITWKLECKLKDAERERKGPQRYKVLLAGET